METLLMQFHGNVHEFKPVDQKSAELLEYNKKLLYLGVEPQVMDVTKHPNFDLSLKRIVTVYFHKKHYPFVFKSFVDKTIIDDLRKLEVLIERGFYQIVVEKLPTMPKDSALPEIMPCWPRFILQTALLEAELLRVIVHPRTHERILPCKISDVDFCRSDYGNAIHSNEWNTFQASDTGKTGSSDLKKHAFYATVIVLGFIGIRMNLLDDVSMFWTMNLSPLFSQIINTFGWLGVAINGILIGGATVIIYRLLKKKKE